MVAVSRDHWVFFAQRGDRSCCNGFLTDVQVTEAANLLHAVQLSRSLFETPDAQHHLIPTEVGFFRERLTVLRRLGGFFLRFFVGLYLGHVSEN
jgi:hypothetical protein